MERLTLRLRICIVLVGSYVLGLLTSIIVNLSGFGGYWLLNFIACVLWGYFWGKL